MYPPPTPEVAVQLLLLVLFVGRDNAVPMSSKMAIQVISRLEGIVR